MGFINVNGQQVHTSNIGGTSSIYNGSGTLSGSNSTITISGTGSTYVTNTTNSTGYAIYSQKAKYVVLGEEFEMDGYQDPTIAMMVATINIMGKAFYDELKKQNVHFPEELDDFIKLRFRILERDEKIEKIITR